MAISVDMIESRNLAKQPVLILPHNKFTRITAAGSITFTDAEITAILGAA